MHRMYRSTRQRHRARGSYDPRGLGRGWERLADLSALAVIFTLCLSYPLLAMAGTPTITSVSSMTPETLHLTLGKSLILTTRTAIKRVTLVAPEIADVILISPRQVYLTPKGVGVTNLSLWAESDQPSAIFEVRVAPDLSRLKENLHEILPGEPIRVSASHDGVTLSGEVSSAVRLSQALAIAEAFTPKKVINLLQVSGVHQVMLEVRVAEMSRSLVRRLGFNFAYLTGAGDFGISLLNNLTSIEETTPRSLKTLISPSINALFRLHSGDKAFTGFIDALKEQGLVKILAEPTLVALSGQTAHFLAGGEFPTPVPQERGVITIEFKKFGVGLNFTPIVLSPEKIHMTVTPEVSELDFSNALVLSGAIVPALTTRRASTVIELGNGQSFAIAGLLRENIREIVSKFPLLGDLPILGALFRSTSFQKHESELMIIVTPHLVKPLDPAKQVLPTDRYREPSDFEWYLLGALEGQPGGKAASGGVELRQRVKLQGEFGHILPRRGEL